MKIGTGTKQVFLKEIREFARDRRVLQASVIMPIFMIAVFVMIMGIVQRTVEEHPTITVAYVHTGDREFLEKLDSAEGIELTPVTSWDAGIELVHAKEARLVMDVPESLMQQIAVGQATIRVGFKSDDPLSMISASTIRQAVAEANSEAIKTVLIEQGLPEHRAQPLKLEQVNVSQSQGMGGSDIVSLLPYLIVLWAFYGGMAIVADLVAGEKERGTMETLLVSPVRRAAVALGKTLALMVVCFLGSLTTVAAVIIVGALQLPFTKSLFPTGMAIHPLDILGIIILLISLVAFFSALLVTVCARSRNIREAQTYLGGLSFIIILPAIFSQIIGFTGMEDALWVRWTPILNTAVQLKNLISGAGHYAGLGPAILLNFVLAAIFLRIAMQLFRREEILLRV